MSKILIFVKAHFQSQSSVDHVNFKTAPSMELSSVISHKIYVSMSVMRWERGRESCPEITTFTASSHHQHNYIIITSHLLPMARSVLYLALPIKNWTLTKTLPINPFKSISFWPDLFESTLSRNGLVSCVVWSTEPWWHKTTPRIIIMKFSWLTFA